MDFINGDEGIETDYATSGVYKGTVYTRGIAIHIENGECTNVVMG